MKSKALFILSLIALTIGVSYAQAQFAPASSPPAGNRPAVVTQSSVGQVKNGGLSINTFSATGYSYFGQDTYFNGTVFGKGGAGSTIQFGGTANGTTYPVEVFVEGAVEASDTIQSPVLKNTEKKKLCADKNGKIQFCN